jgi:ribosome-associated protein
MARKPRPFDADEPAEGDELEAQEAPSRSARKRMSHDLRRLGEELVALRPERLRDLPLPEQLEEAIAEARRLTSFGARRRQVQFIGKLMRRLDEDSVAAIRRALARN